MKSLKEIKKAKKSDWDLPRKSPFKDPAKLRKYVEQVILPEKIKELRKTKNIDIQDDYFDFLFRNNQNYKNF